MPAIAGEKIVRFLHRQTKEIRKGGLPVLLRNTRALLVMAPALLLAIPLILFMRALRPLILIRLGPLVTSRIGPFAMHTELYLCRRDVGMDRRRVFDIFYHGSAICCNQQLKKMWDRTLRVSNFACPVDKLNRHLPGYEDHVIPMDDRDIHGLLARTRVHLSFTPEEEHRGWEGLQELGISNGAPFVCFHSRDSAYLDAALPYWGWHYHDFRDSNINNFIPAAEELVHRGYFAVRMGAVVKEPLQTTNPMVIDYATKGRTEFLDIFLGAKCHFYLGDPCGLYQVFEVFRRPCASINVLPLEWTYTWSPTRLFIPKKLWLREERRFLTFREIFDSGIGRFLHSEQYEQQGIEVVENTPEEIAALAVEMDERLRGTWQTTEEDEQLQRSFWSLFKPSELHGTIVSRIGAEFLRQNRELLD